MQMIYKITKRTQKIKPQLEVNPRDTNLCSESFRISLLRIPKNIQILTTKNHYVGPYESSIEHYSEHHDVSLQIIVYMETFQHNISLNQTLDINFNNVTASLPVYMTLSIIQAKE